MLESRERILLSLTSRGVHHPLPSRLLPERRLKLSCARGLPSPDEGNLQEVFLLVGSQDFAFLRMPQARNGIVSEVKLTWFDSRSIIESQSTIYHLVALDEFLKLSEPVSSSVIEIIVPTSSNLLELNTITCTKYQAHCQTPD